MKKTIKISDDYKISGKLIFDKENNKWFIEILDNWKWIEKSINFENFDDLDKAIDELKHRIKRIKNYKLWFSIMKPNRRAKARTIGARYWMPQRMEAQK